MKKLLFVFTLLVGFGAQGQNIATRTFGKDPIINMENFQKQRVHWGYYLGFNSYDFKFDYKQPGEDIIVDGSTGFNVGLIGNLRLMEYVDLRFEPGLYYTQRNLRFPGFDNDILALREVKSTYVHLPLLLKFSSLRTGNVRPYLVGGVSASMNLTSNYNSEQDNSEYRFRMNQWTTNYEVGFGIDLFFEWFIFSPSIRGVFSFNDEVIQDKNPSSPWTSNIDAMRTRAVFVNFAFH